MHIKRVRHNTWYPKIIQCEKDVPLIFQHQPFILNPCWGTSILGKPARAKVRVDHQDFGKGQDLSQFTVNTWPNGISRRWLDMAYTYHLQKLWFGGSFKILWPCFTHITILYHAQAPSHLYHLQSAVIEPCCTPSLPNCCRFLASPSRSSRLSPALTVHGAIQILPQPEVQQSSLLRQEPLSWPISWPGETSSGCHGFCGWVLMRTPTDLNHVSLCVYRMCVIKSVLNIFLISHIFPNLMFPYVLQLIVNCWLPHEPQTNEPHGHMCGLATCSHYNLFIK